MKSPVPSWLLTLDYCVLWLGQYGTFIPLSIGLRRWRYLSASGRCIVYYFGFWATEALLDLWSRKVLHDNGYLFHLSVLVETWLLGWAYYRALDLKPIRRIMPWIGCVFTWLAFSEAFWFGSLHQLNRITRAAQVVLMLTVILLYFEQWTRETHARLPSRTLMFLVSTGLAIYYAGSVMGYMLQTGALTVQECIVGITIDTAFAISVTLMTIGLRHDQRTEDDAAVAVEVDER